MYEIGKVYIWIACYNDASIIGKETTVTGEVQSAYVFGSDRKVQIQATDTKISYPMGSTGVVHAQKGMLIPKDRPSGERKVMDQFQPKPELEPT